MEESKWTMEVGEVFTVERTMSASTGLRFALCRLEGGIALFDTYVEPVETDLLGSPGKQVFVFKCIRSGAASIQFGYTHAPNPKIFIYEQVFPIEVIDGDAKSEPTVCIPGGWSPARELQPEEEELFKSAMGKRIGISYKPIDVCTQIVAGTRYRFTCETELATNPPKRRHAQVFIFAPLPGKGNPCYEKTVFLLGDVTLDL